MTRVARYVKSNAIAVVAVFIALGGTSYAAFAIPKNSVGNRQLKNYSISPIKFERGTIAGYVRDWVKIDPTGAIIASRPRAHLVNWSELPTATASGGVVAWGNPPSGGQLMPTGCFAVATTSTVGPAATYASAFVTVVGRGNKSAVEANVRVSAPQQGVDVAVLCPQP